MPFNYQAFDEHIDKYPSKYPCILEFHDYSSNEGGYSFHIEIIEDISGFVYRDGSLYKAESSDFIIQNGVLYKKC